MGFGDPVVLVLSLVYLVPAAAIAVPVHELGHAYAAYLQGDRTPRARGYMRYPDSLRLYFDNYGLLAAALWNVAWGSPAPVNEYKLDGVVPKLIHALAGPLANLAVAAVFAAVLRALGTVPFVFRAPTDPRDALVLLIFAIYFLNLSTFAFNLLPIPGLDGWRVLEAIFRSRYPRFFFDVWSRRREVWAVLIVLVFIGSFAGLSPLGYAVSIFFRPFSTILVGSCVGYEFILPCQL